MQQSSLIRATTSSTSVKNTTKFWFLEDFSLMKKMGRWNLMKVCHLLEMQTISKGEVLDFKREDKRVVYFLKSGTVKIVGGANQHTQHIVKKGNIFGELALTDDSPGDTNQAVVLEDGIVCFMEADLMQGLMEKHDSLKNGILKLQGIRIRRLERKLEDLLYKDSPTRIHEFLVDYLQEFGNRNGSKLEAKNLLSHSDIANLTNTSRQTVNNVLSNLRKQGVIDYDARIIQMELN